MKKYDCDGGSIMIGTKESRACFPNGYGDGCFSVQIINTEENRKKFHEENKHNVWHWMGTVEGTKFYVWSYDCLHEDELDESNVLYTLSGRYAVYRNNGKIVLENWG